MAPTAAAVLVNIVRLVVLDVVIVNILFSFKNVRNPLKIAIRQF